MVPFLLLLALILLLAHASGATIEINSNAEAKIEFYESGALASILKGGAGALNSSTPIYAPDFVLVDGNAMSTLLATVTTLQGEVAALQAQVQGLLPSPPSPPRLPTVRAGGRTLVSGSWFGTCALLESLHVKCWGPGQGYGDTVKRGSAPNTMGDNLPAVDLGTGELAVELAAMKLGMCALLAGGNVKCWGSNTNGQLGLGDKTSRGTQPGEMGDALPYVDLGTGRHAIALFGGHYAYHMCALLDNSGLKCWGLNSNGQLGLGDRVNRGDDPGEMGDALPYVDLGSGRSARHVTVADIHTCVLMDDSNVKCWGYGYSNGYLGYGDSSYRGVSPNQMGDNLPVVDLGTGRTAVSIDCTQSHCYAVLDNGFFKCWGYEKTDYWGGALNGRRNSRRWPQRDG